MATSGTLYTYPENFRAYKALIAAKYSGFNLKTSPNFVFGETNKTEAFLKKFPGGKVPAFESSDGKTLTDSNAISYYVASEKLRGQSKYETAQVLQWLGFADSEILPAACAWAFPVMGILHWNKQTVEAAKSDVGHALTVLNAHLMTRTYLVGERLSLADIGVACNLLHLFTHCMDPAYRKPYCNLERWFKTVVNQPEFLAVAGKTQLCTEAPAETQSHHKKKDKKEDKQQKQQQQQQQQQQPKQKKEDKKKEQSKPAEEELDPAEEALAAEPKSKDPFDAMPKGTFVMDEFKRAYSNEDTDVSIPKFWEKFDPENYSIWFGEYKYNDELTKTFMSCNLITGMFQRLDKMRKHSFASVCLFGTDNDSSISGIWVWRGKDLAFTLCSDWQIDYETYDWKMLDPSSEETKKLVNHYLAWTGEDSKGRKFNQGKIFK